MTPRWQLLAGVLLAVAVAGCLASSSAEPKGERKARLSIFNVVRFPNEACGGTGNRNGTCYTEQECENRDGTNSGTCADGYGVCCTFSLECGDMSKENCTYFESSGMSGGTCRAKICMTNNDICQLRLDFNTFVITGPSTGTDTAYATAFGTVATGGAIKMSHNTQCNTDTFSVTNPGGEAPPVICGTNSGSHMYVQASDACNDLVFQMNSPRLTGTSAPVGTGTASTTRMWNIKVSQIACDDIMKAPQGCTQYFYDTSAAGQIQSFNYDGGSHLANQNQNICIRRERGMCRICYSADATTDVMLSGSAAGGVVKGSSCCGYGTDGMMTKFDCLQIPGGIKNTANVATMRMELSEICGRTAGLVTATGTISTTVCTDRLPFSIRFVSDAFESPGEVLLPSATDTTDIGFKIRYWQNNNCVT